MVERSSKSTSSYQIETLNVRSSIAQVAAIRSFATRDIDELQQPHAHGVARYGVEPSSASIESPTRSLDASYVPLGTCASPVPNGLSSRQMLVCSGRLVDHVRAQPRLNVKPPALASSPRPSV